jgi:hypothetical protein
MCTTDRPLRAVRIDVTTPVLPADDRGMRVDRDERRAKRERRRHQISRKILHIVFSILKDLMLITFEQTHRMVEPLMAPPLIKGWRQEFGKNRAATAGD